MSQVLSARHQELHLRCSNLPLYNLCDTMPCGTTKLTWQDPLLRVWLPPMTSAHSNRMVLYNIFLRWWIGWVGVFFPFFACLFLFLYAHEGIFHLTSSSVKVSESAASPFAVIWSSSWQTQLAEKVLLKCVQPTVCICVYLCLCVCEWRLFWCCRLWQGVHWSATRWESRWTRVAVLTDVSVALLLLFSTPISVCACLTVCVCACARATPLPAVSSLSN